MHVLFAKRWSITSSSLSLWYAVQLIHLELICLDAVSLSQWCTTRCLRLNIVQVTVLCTTQELHKSYTLDAVHTLHHVVPHQRLARTVLLVAASGCISGFNHSRMASRQITASVINHGRLHNFWSPGEPTRNSRWRWSLEWAGWGASSPVEAIQLAGFT